jgi:mutual gliding-motility protein MglA
MIYDYENKTLQVKIVYYGAAMSGKTTSIKYLFTYFNKKSNLESIDSSVGRTLLFDFGILHFQGINWGLKFLIYSATGQDFYASTRPATLNGVDGIIFVVDSKIDCLNHNLQSWNELKVLFGSEFYRIPVVISLNKYDLCDKMKIQSKDFIEKIDYYEFKQITIKKTKAINGEGILDSFNGLVNFIFPQISLNTSIVN